MGFTRYWRRPQELDEARFIEFASECQDTCAAMPVTLVNSQFDSKIVTFSGLPGCEPFVLERISNGRVRDGLVSEFCKTQSLAYDQAVAACLDLLSSYFMEVEVIPPP